MYNFYWPKNSLKTNLKKEDNTTSKPSINQLQNNKPSIETIQQTSNIISNKLNQLENLKQNIENNERKYFKSHSNNFILNDGNIDAQLMFIGEAPGQEEDLKGYPFVGKSGQLLRSFLKDALITDYYITNIIPWRPPNNKTPTNTEIDIMKPYIIEHIKIIKPKIVITVGTTALKAFNIQETITNVQNTLISTEFGNIFPIYHPSYALRVNAKKKELWYSLLNLKNIVDSQ